MKYIALLFCLILNSLLLYAETFIVHNDSTHYNVSHAANLASPGDTILVLGDLDGGDYVENLHGEPGNEIVITGEIDKENLISGGTTAIHFVNITYVKLRYLSFEGQTGNGINIDDGGDYSTPSEYVEISNCDWLGMAADGNNDELKLSGLDNFVIQNCKFRNGAAGGSIIDMVGCHNGIIELNEFGEGGSNCIQAKGGTADITIRRNFFLDGGQRSINIGGSTGLQFFRPLGESFESARILVYSNVFVGSMAPVAFVGTLNSRVINNSFYEPEKWVFRILQENTEPGIQTCADNEFSNNICFVTDASSVYAVNIGPNTAPETFIFNNNLWFNVDNPNWNGPNLPATESNGLLNLDPEFVDINELDLSIIPASPAIGAGKHYENIDLDFGGYPFNNPPSIGAIEGNVPNGIFVEDHVSKSIKYKVEGRVINIEALWGTLKEVSVYNMNGGLVKRIKSNGNALSIDMESLHLYKGIYFIAVWNTVEFRFIKMIL